MIAKSVTLSILQLLLSIISCEKNNYAGYTRSTSASAE